MTGLTVGRLEVLNENGSECEVHAMPVSTQQIPTNYAYAANLVRQHQRDGRKFNYRIISGPAQTGICSADEMVTLAVMTGWAPR